MLKPDEVDRLRRIGAHLGENVSHLFRTQGLFDGVDFRVVNHSDHLHAVWIVGPAYDAPLTDSRRRVQPRHIEREIEVFKTAIYNESRPWFSPRV